MNAWGLSRWGALLAVLLLLVGGVMLPQSVHAQGKKVYGQVTDCATNNPVAATVVLVDVHGQRAPQSVTTSGSTGFFVFEPEPGYYRLEISSGGFNHFPKDDGPFRFDGMKNEQRNVCLDPIPQKPFDLDVTVLDAQSTLVENETVAFEEFDRGPENVTNPSEPGGIDYDWNTNRVQLDTKPLVWSSEELVWTNATTILGGETLRRFVHYDYNAAEAFNGQIRITDVTIQAQLYDTLFNGPSKGWLEVSYRNASTSSSLANRNVLNEMFYRNVTLLTPYTNYLDLDLETGALEITSDTWRFGCDVLNATYEWARPIAGASVTAFAQVEGEPIGAAVTTDADGKATVRVYAAIFDVKFEADSYASRVVNYVVSGDTTDRVFLFKGWAVRAVVVDAEDIDPITADDGLTGVMINTGPVNMEIQVVRGIAEDNLLTFFVYDGTWDLIVDANHYSAKTTPIVVFGGNESETVLLDPSVEERAETRVLFWGQDWGNLTVYRNLTLPADAAFPGVASGFVRDVEWQLDLEHGDRNGVWTPGENTAFVTNFVTPNGPFFTTSDSFLTVNGKTYKSVDTSYGATVTPQGDGSFDVVSWANYNLTEPSKGIKPSQPIYYLNVTTIADRNVTHYQNNTYFIHLPRTYELTRKDLTGKVVTRGFVTVEVDPEVDSSNPNPRAELVVEKSLTGVARAEVEGPAGKVYVKNSNQDNYTAWVANDTAIVFSANLTTDRKNEAVNAESANFTWNFRNETGAADNGYGIWTTFDYGNVNGEFIVNLTVTQVNPDNRTWHDIRVFVDNQAPEATFKTNVTGSQLNPTELAVDEDIPVKYDGSNSTDTLDGTEEGEIAEYSWDFDGDGNEDSASKILTRSYEDPGTFWFNFSVVDRVGHRSENATMFVTVDDTTPPHVDFFMLEPISWQETSALIENEPYWFNASTTTDNALEVPEDNLNLTYEWDFGDGTKIGPGEGDELVAGQTYTHINVTHTYAEFSSGYTLKLKVTDLSGNNDTLKRTIIVQANTTLHPDIRVISSTLKVSPSSVEEGQTVTFTVNITNLEERANATTLRVQLKVIVDGEEENATDAETTYLIGTVAPEQARLDSGKNSTVTVRWTARSPPANYSVKIVVWDEDEPEAWVTGLNEVSSSVLVKEAGYRIWVIVGAILFIVIGIPIIIWVVRKVRAGDLALPKRRRKGEDEDEDEGDEEETDEDEEDEDEEEESGKKRL